MSTLEYVAQDDGTILEMRDGRVTATIVPPEGMTTLEALNVIAEVARNVEKAKQSTN